MKEFLEKVEDFVDSVKEDPRKQILFAAACAFVIGFVIGML